jgi:pyridoxamine 5'-phosphate oxidase
MAQPENPLPLAAKWLAEAETDPTKRNPLAMALATCAPGGRPSVRMVLAKRFSEAHGYVVFFTHYESRKAGELEAAGRAAAAFYWESFGGRQLRLEGPVVRSPVAESADYFATRPVQSQLNAWVSEQSRTLESMQILRDRCDAKAAEYGIDAQALAHAEPGPVPCPPNWGGFRLWIDTLEFWTEGAGRFHERSRYTRTLKRSDSEFVASPWQFDRLQP